MSDRMAVGLAVRTLRLFGRTIPNRPPAFDFSSPASSTERSTSRMSSNVRMLTPRLVAGRPFAAATQELLDQRLG